MMEKMECKMERGERAKIKEGYVEISKYNDSMVKYFTINGKFLKEFSKDELRNENNIITAGNCIFIKSNKNWKIFTLEGLELSGNYENVFRWGDTVVVKKRNKYCFFNPETRKTEGEFDFYFEEKRTGKTFVILYKNNKCGLYQLNKKLVEILPIKYKSIKIYQKKVEVRTTENDEEDIDFNEIVYKPDNKEEQPEEQVVLFLGKIKLNTTQEIVRLKNYFMVVDEIEAQYYNLKGDYVGTSSILTKFGQKVGNYIEMGEVIALCKKEGSPFLKRESWTLYNKDGKNVLNKKFEEVKALPLNQFAFCYEANGSWNNQASISIAVINQQTGKVLFEVSGYKEITKTKNNCFKTVDYNNKIEILTVKGKNLFDRKFEEKDIIEIDDVLLVKDQKEEYKVISEYSIYSIRAHSVTKCTDLTRNMRNFVKISRNGKLGILELKEDNYKELIPIEYSEIKASPKFILATKAQNEYQDIYDLSGNLVYSTR